MAGTMPQDALLAGLSYLVGITDNDETEIFKMCLDYWLHFSNQLHAFEQTYLKTASQSVCVWGDTACVVVSRMLAACNA